MLQRYRDLVCRHCTSYVLVMYSQRESTNGTEVAFLAVRPVKCDPSLCPEAIIRVRATNALIVFCRCAVCTGMTNTRALLLIRVRAKGNALIITPIYFRIYLDKNCRYQM